MNLAKILSFPLLILSSLTLIHCDEIDAATDCNQICNKANDCFGGVDVSDCSSTCSGKAKDNDSFQAKLDECENCLDGKACSEANGCTAECFEVVTRSTL